MNIIDIHGPKVLVELFLDIVPFSYSFLMIIKNDYITGQHNNTDSETANNTQQFHHLFIPSFLFDAFLVIVNYA